MPRKKTVKNIRTRKISDKEFFAILRENAGIYARTARAIEKQFNIKYTRQAVRQRAEQNPEELHDIREENIDVAEEGLHSLMRSKDEKTKLQAVKLYLTTIGRNRGYSERLELSGPDGGAIKSENTFTGFSFLPAKASEDEK